MADLGGEFSHAAILLREAGIPAVVNATGAFAALGDGDRVQVDPGRGEVVASAFPAGMPESSGSSLGASPGGLVGPSPAPAAIS